LTLPSAAFGSVQIGPGAPFTVIAALDGFLKGEFAKL
jgi:hypothetical protein